MHWPTGCELPSDVITILCNIPTHDTLTFGSGFQWSWSWSSWCWANLPSPQPILPSTCILLKSSPLLYGRCACDVQCSFEKEKKNSVQQYIFSKRFWAFRTICLRCFANPTVLHVKLPLKTLSFFFLSFFFSSKTPAFCTINTLSLLYRFVCTQWWGITVKLFMVPLYVKGKVLHHQSSVLLPLFWSVCMLAVKQSEQQQQAKYYSVF